MRYLIFYEFKSFVLISPVFLNKQKKRGVILLNVLQQQHLLYFPFFVSEDAGILCAALTAAFNINYS